MASQNTSWTCSSAFGTRLAAISVCIGLGCALSTMPVLSASAQGALEKATLRLDFLPGGYHAPFFLALDRGYYKQQGIDLEVFDGKGSSATIQVVASGTDTFGVANLSAMAIAISKGVPLIGVGAVIQKSPDSLISLAGSGITKPKDVEGKRGAFVPTGAGDRMFPAFAKANKIDVDKITRLNVSAEARYSVVLQGNADFMVGWSFTDALRIAKQKPISPPVLFSDYGVTMLGVGVFVTKDVATNRSKLVRAFLAATVKGAEEAIKDPPGAVAAVAKLRPDSDTALLLEGVKNLAKFIRTPNSASMPLLAMAKADWEESTNNLVTYLDLPPSMKSDAFYTNEFLPTP